MKQAIIRASADTLAHFGTLGGIAGLIGFPGFVLAARFYEKGSQHVMHAVWDELWAVAVAIPAWLAIVFAFNLICAPYRIARDTVLSTKAALAVATARVEQLEAAAKPIGRSISPAQKLTLISAFMSPDQPERLNVLFPGMSEEAADLAVEIGDAIKEAGIECDVHDGVMFSHDLSARGVVIYHGPSDASRNYRERVHSAFVGIGLASVCQLMPDREDGLLVYVARRP